MPEYFDTMWRSPVGVELEPSEISLSRTILCLAVTPYEDRSKEKIEELLGNELFSQSLAQFHKEEVSEDEKYAAEKAHAFLDSVRDELLIYPIELARDAPEDDDVAAGSPRFRYEEPGERKDGEDTHIVSGISRADAFQILELVRDYRSLNPVLIQAIMARDVLFYESILSASRRLLKYQAGEGDIDSVLDPCDTYHLIRKYLYNTDYPDFPPEMRIFFERKVSVLFRVNKVNNIHTFTRRGLNIDLDPFVIVDAARQILEKAETTPVKAPEAETVSGEPVSEDAPGSEKTPKRPLRKPTLIIDDPLVDQFMEVLDQRL